MVTLLFLCVSLQANSIDTLIEKTQDADKKSERSQTKINDYSDKSEKIYDEYVRVKKELDEQYAYNKQINMILSTQEKEIPQLQHQLKEIEVTNRKIIPLMFEMIEKLEKFVSIDTPFMKEERSKRVDNLKTFLANPDITTAEQFRTILESYKIEYGYSRTFEAYRSELNEADGKTKTVDFLRVGRLAFYYQTLDSKESGLFDFKTGKWVILDEDYNELLKTGIKMARKKVSPDFLTLALFSNKAEK